ncbi:PIN domain nuclease of toxin-antitoxin system [Paraburkholderia sp. BL23I1N1]|uniref:type II toxin-antitoxin system VapC family toxin n=1 Tax=Paraburkholderia sp. BL23I1N1 TaxID=1938802 RepID=UPI000E739B6B|nr:type II toxin-antitoxin system VapC family toxin [Paraburkholderia sp. BL23I1N1]RKE38580.1 PIN domain nuclease of toxin-antitoxin system [Paraburkholderia sp. BL23I1N1]
MITLDTYGAIYWPGDCTELSDATRMEIADTLDGGEVPISSISVLEVAQFAEIGRLALSIEDVWMVPVVTAIVMLAASMPPVLRVAQRLSAAHGTLGVPLATLDLRVRKLTQVETWDIERLLWRLQLTCVAGSSRLSGA